VPQPIQPAVARQPAATPRPIVRASMWGADDDEPRVHLLGQDAPREPDGHVVNAAAPSQLADDVPSPARTRSIVLKAVDITPQMEPVRPLRKLIDAAPIRASLTEMMTSATVEIPQVMQIVSEEEGQLPAGSIIYDLGPVYRFYASAEYLLWWTKGFRVPPLVTSGTGAVPQDFRGILGSPDTTTLFGNSRTSSGPSSGGRFYAGYNLDPCGLCAIEGGYFFLGNKNDRFNAAGGELSRPFFNINTGMQDRELTSSPGTAPGDVFALNGAITVQARSSLQGAEANVRKLCCMDCNYRLSALAGFRYLDLNEGLLIQENVTSLKAIPGFDIFNPGNNIVVTDEFNTRNRFYGGQVGLDGVLQRGRWFVGGRAKLALGVTDQSINIAGSQVVTTPAGGVTTFNGGLLALPSNIGHFSQSRFTFVPEVGMRVGYNVTDNIRVYVGYDILYWSSVVRPGDQVDLTLNVNQIPNFSANPVFSPPSTNVRPVVPFRTSDYIAHGINAGLEIRY
jgi:hypothetical protein